MWDVELDVIHQHHFSAVLCVWARQGFSRLPCFPYAGRRCSDSVHALLVSRYCTSSFNSIAVPPELPIDCRFNLPCYPTDPRSDIFSYRFYPCYTRQAPISLPPLNPVLIFSTSLFINITEKSS